MSTVAIIPARAGSKGLPKKQLRLLAGQPMIVHTIHAALAAGSVDRVVVTTDSAAIARVASEAGAEVPFLRPIELAGDNTPTHPVILHAVEWLESRGTVIDVIITLQPTSPLRRSTEIDTTVALLQDPLVQSAATVALLPWPSSVVGRVEGGKLIRLAPVGPVRRQESSPAARLTGGVYVTRRSLLAKGVLLDEHPSILVVDEASGIDVDTAADLAAARRAWRVVRRDADG